MATNINVQLFVEVEIEYWPKAGLFKIRRIAFNFHNSSTLVILLDMHISQQTETIIT